MRRTFLLIICANYKTDEQLKRQIMIFEYKILVKLKRQNLHILSFCKVILFIQIDFWYS